MRKMLRNPDSRLWGVLDQILQSGSNFILMTLLARSLGPADFGAFVLIFTIFLFMNEIQSSLLTGPHNVLGAPMEQGQFLAYTNAVVRLQLLLSLLVATVFAILAIVFWSSGTGSLALAFAPVAALWQGQECLRRVLYTKSLFRAAFTNDIGMFGCQLLGVTSLWIAGALTPVTAVLAIGIGAVVSVSLGAARHQQLLWGPASHEEIKKHLASNWEYGKWLLGGSLMNWTAGRMYPVLVAGFIGLSATGALRAAESLMSPMNVLVLSSTAMVPPHASRLWKMPNHSAYFRFLRRVVVLSLGTMALYGLFVAVFHQSLMRSLFGDEYLPFAWLAVAYAWMYLIGNVSTLISLMLKSMHATAPLFFARMLAAVFTLTCGIWLVAILGLKGAVLGLVLQQVITLSVLAVYAAITLKRETAATRAKLGETVSEDVRLESG